MMRKGIITFFILALVVLYVIIYIVPGVTGMLDSTYVVEYGVLSIHDDTTGYLIRNERVYAAENSGMVNRVSTEGDLLRRGITVIDISGTSIGTPSQRLREIKDSLDVSMVTSHGNYSQGGGIVSYFVDGYENALTTENALYYRKNDFDGISQDQVVSLGTSAYQGYPVFKLIDNTKWYLIAYVPLSSQDDYPIGKHVDVLFTKSNDTIVEETENENIAENAETNVNEENPLNDSDTYGTVEMRVIAAEEENGSVRLVLESSRFFSGLGELRVAECRIISASVRGLLVETGSIVEEDGRPGVYVKTKTGKYEFVPVNILGDTEKTTVISDMYFYDEEGVWTRTVDPFDDILRNPETKETEETDEGDA